LGIEGKNPSHIRLGTITIAICSILLIGPASASQFAFADGNDSPLLLMQLLAPSIKYVLKMVKVPLELSKIQANTVF